ncbi:MAG: MFS transporter [Chloroflexi bacterium]|nr:MFS transporter [Chloroflexota bacterium]
MARLRIERPRLPAFPGWRIVASGAVIQATQSALLMQAFANYSVLLHRELGWSKSMLAAAFSMTRVESGLLGPLQGWALDRFGPRAVMQVGTLVLGIGFLLFSQMQTPVQFFSFYFLMSLGSSLGGFLSITVAIVNWFERRRSTALALSQSGFAIGGLLTPLVAFALTHAGWRETAFASGVIVMVIGLPFAQLMHHRPDEVGQHVDGISPEQRAVAAERSGVEDTPVVSFTAREALRTPAFWLISLGHGSALLVVGTVMLHLSLHLTESLGYTVQQASFVGGALPLMQLVGHVSGGLLGDRVSKRAIIVACMIGHMLGLLLLAYAVSTWMVIAFVPLHGLAWGGRGPLMQAIRADYFGPASYGTIMGFSSMVTMVGMITGPLLAGVLADATGDYRLGMTILALLAGIGSVFFILATPPGPPTRGTPAPVRPEPAEAAAGAATSG